MPKQGAKGVGLMESDYHRVKIPSRKKRLNRVKEKDDKNTVGARI